MSFIETEPIYCQLLGMTEDGDGHRTELSVWEGWCTQDKIGAYQPMDPTIFPDLVHRKWVGAFRWRRLPRNLWPTVNAPAH